MAAQRIKAVRIRTHAGDTFTYRDVSRVFTNGDGSVTIMKGSNIPACGRHSNVAGVSYPKR
jgi:hypothetical protein